MIAKLIQIGRDWVAVDAQNSVCGVYKWLGDESIVREVKTSVTGSQKADNIPEALKRLERTARPPNIRMIGD